MKKEKKRNMKRIIIISALCFVVICIAGYFILINLARKDFRKMPFGNNFPKSNFKEDGNFQPLNDSTKLKITSFFENSPSSSEIEEYCSENPMYCMYYCVEINPDNEICDEIMENKMPPQGIQR